ncbi:MAG: glycosyl transferase family 2 [Saprospirales bacterium]|nr:glycosyl transferase family 2 [Saprospirales bacterium]
MPQITIIMPAYNAEETLAKTLSEIPPSIAQHVILTDDASTDNTLRAAEELNIDIIIQHEFNKGYGANQKSCYRKALDIGSDIIVMLHPDYQYSPKLIPAMVAMITSGHYDVILASRILSGGALKGGMPLYKYVANRLLTFTQNLFMGLKLSEYHTGYRAFRSDVLQSIDFESNSDDFIFDNQLLAQIASKNFAIGEITCPTKYFKEASSINLRRSVIYGLGCLRITWLYFLWRVKLHKTLKV